MPRPTISITGATGFVGSGLVRHFAALGWPVQATGRGVAPASLLACARYLRGGGQQSAVL